MEKPYDAIPYYALFGFALRIAFAFRTRDDGKASGLARTGVWLTPLDHMSGEGRPFHKSLHASEQDRPDVARQRVRWKTHQHKLNRRTSSSSTRPGPRPI
jgi:hypothetical protein